MVEFQVENNYIILFHYITIYPDDEGFGSVVLDINASTVRVRGASASESIYNPFPVSETLEFMSNK